MTTAVALLAAVGAVFLCSRSSADPAIQFAAGSQGPIPAGSEHTVWIEATWPADEAPAAVWAEVPEQPAWGTVTLGPLEVRGDTDTRTYAQAVTLFVREPGAYTLEGVSFYTSETLQSFPVEAQDALNTDVSPALIPLRAPALPLEVKSPSPSAWVFAGMLLCGGVLLTAAAVLLRRRKAQVAAVGGPEPVSGVDPIPPDEFDAALVEARRLRIEGDIYGFYRGLADAVAADPGLVERLRRKAEDVGYRHITPPADELDGDLREVERVLARYKEKNER